MSRGGCFRQWKPEPLLDCVCLRRVRSMSVRAEAFVHSLIVCLHLVNACPAAWVALKSPAVTTGQGLAFPFHSLF